VAGDRETAARAAPARGYRRRSRKLESPLECLFFQALRVGRDAGVEARTHRIHRWGRVATVPVWVEIYRSLQPSDCDERLLLLESVGIAAVARRDVDTFGVWVAPEDAGRAYFELTRYGAENRPAPPPTRTPLHGGAVPSACLYVLVLFVCGALAANGALGRDWLSAGALDGAAFRNGEAWRAITALTLHADLAHLAANAGFGGLFGALAARVYGAGRAWLAVLAAATLANVLNGAWMPAGRISLGASTAVFAALGLLCVFPWPDLRRTARAGVRGASIVAALVLLALLGTGDERTDVAAHALGFGCGMLTGLALVRVHATRRLHDGTAALLALTAVCAAWVVALYP
jgi:membrane associated rhomboid family serine protease